MGNKLYLECFSGISGDMFVAALLDLGADETHLKEVLRTIPVQGFDVKVEHVKKSGLAACDFAVILDEAHENHDHDMEYLYGHEAHEHHHEHSHEAHEHHHEHSHEEHEHEHHHGHHHHEHRGLADVLHIIGHTQMSPRAKRTAERIFTILGEAEAKAHGTTLEEVHFHEVGAVDSIVDIIAAAVCLDDLDVEETIIPVLCEGSGTVRCQHGILPVPVPATANIAAANGLSLRIIPRQGELVTPTGAAIAAAIRTSKVLPEQFEIERIGIGAGKRAYECPSILRAMLIKDTAKKTDQVWKLETNMDDCSGECLGYVMGELLDAGALDVSYTPIYMKKNRPAYELTVICEEADRVQLEQMIFRHTTTIGIRRMPVQRTTLAREKAEVLTSLGNVQVKICDIDGEKRIYPEYESVASVCRERGCSYQDAIQKITGECYDKLR